MADFGECEPPETVPTLNNKRDMSMQHPNQTPSSSRRGILDLPPIAGQNLRQLLPTTCPYERTDTAITCEIRANYCCYG